MKVYFEVYDSSKGEVEEKIVTVTDLGSHEEQCFSVPLSNNCQQAVLRGFEYLYRDGSVEKVSLR